jgi:hypothetical protein
VALSRDNQVVVCSSAGEDVLTWDLQSPGRLEQGATGARNASKTLESRPDDTESLNKLGEWLEFNGQAELAVRLLGEHPGLAPSIASARCRWRTGDAARSATEFEALAGRAGEGDYRDYLLACARAAKAAQP